jgi:hypothetical protein
VGLKRSGGLKDNFEETSRKALYPAYELWCRKRGLIPIGHIYFSNSLIDNADRLGIRVSKKRTSWGMMIMGIQLNSLAFAKSQQYGAPLIPSAVNPEETVVSPSSETTNELAMSHVWQKAHPSIGSDLYPKYLKALGASRRKSELNEYSKGIVLDLERLTEDYVSQALIKTELFRQGVYDEFSKARRDSKKRSNPNSL